MSVLEGSCRKIPQEGCAVKFALSFFFGHILPPPTFDHRFTRTERCKIISNRQHRSRDPSGQIDDFLVFLVAFHFLPQVMHRGIQNEADVPKLRPVISLIC